MPVKRTTNNMQGDRYIFDFKVCTYAKGWAQFDSGKDASYYGTWVNPTLRQKFNYCEGDIALEEADTDEEFVALLREFARWNDERGYGPARIDPGLDPAMKEAFVKIGVADLLY